MITKPDFASEKQCANRLLLDYKKYGNICIAFDYDNTLFDYHGNDPKNIRACLDLMLRCQDRGIDLVVWSCSPETRHSEIRKYLNNNGITEYLINDVEPQYKFSETPKPFFSLLLDDRAGLGSAMRTLSVFLNAINA